jgi:uncharacterized protein with PQ loop repeat
MSVNTHHTHFHKRKKKAKKSNIDRLVYFAAIFGPLMTLPQVYDVWVADTPGVSVITWLAYCLIAVIWLAYGLKHKDKPIIILQVLWLILDIAVVAGTLSA